MKRAIRAFVLFCLIITITNCQRRYWYRSMILVPSKTTVPANMIVFNESPNQISEKFIEEIKTACAKQLLKKGYLVTTKKAKLQFELSIKVQAFRVNGLAHYGGERTTQYPYFDKDVKAIMFDCAMFQTNNDLKWKIWENKNDLYYFNKQKRDMNRSIGMVKYLIRSAKQLQ